MTVGMQSVTVYGCKCCRRRMTRPAVAANVLAVLRCHLPCPTCQGPCRRTIQPVAAPKAPAPAARAPARQPLPSGPRPPPLFKRSAAEPVARVWRGLDGSW